MSKTSPDLPLASPRPICIAIGGVSRSGKTFLSKMLHEKLSDSIIIHQDEYIPTKDTIPRIQNHIDWETPLAIDWESFNNAIDGARKSHKFVIAEGLFVYRQPELNAYYDRKIFITISEREFMNRKRSDLRWGREPEWYIQHIWEGHLRYGSLPGHFTDTLIIDGEKVFCIDDIIQKLEIPN